MSAGAGRSRSPRTGQSGRRLPLWLAGRHDGVDVPVLLESVSAWAREHHDVVGLALVGSHARGTSRPDSDVDFVILSERPERLTDNREWTARFGSASSVTTEDYGRLVSVRVFYDDGREVEFGVAGPGWAAVPLDPGTRRVLSGGVRILYDPKGLLRAATVASD